MSKLYPFRVDSFLERRQITDRLFLLKVYSFSLTLSALNFRRHLSSAFYFNKLSFGKAFICKVERLNVIEPSHLDLCYLQKPIIIMAVKEFKFYFT